MTIEFLSPPEIPPHLLELIELQREAIREITSINVPLGIQAHLDNVGIPTGTMSECSLDTEQKT